MRLIDADKLLKLIKEQKVKETGAYTRGLNAGLNIVKSIINGKTQTLTAYDVDKVVEQLEQKMKRARDKEQENTSEYFEGEADGFEFAIEIVKAGGIDGN